MTRPYYADDLVTLYHGKCEEIAEWLAADVLVFDPPYGRGQLGIDMRSTGVFSSGTDSHRPGISGDEDTAVRDFVLAAWGKRPAMVFGDLRVPAPAFTKQVAVYRKPPDAGHRSTAGFRRDIEGIYLLHLPAGYGGITSVVETSARKVNGNSVGLGARYGHPHAKPVDTLEELISHCPPGVIADPCAGSGTTLVAARNLGRHAIGVELEERYCVRAARNLSQMILEAS